jgi:hypothetical protein
MQGTKGGSEMQTEGRPFGIPVWLAVSRERPPLAGEGL